MQHPKAQVVVFSDKEVLLFQMNEKRGGFWQNITGSVEKNESHLIGALREFQEETGFAYDDIKSVHTLKCAFKFQDQYKKNVLEKCFAVFLHQKKNPTLDSSEHQSFKWIAIDQVTEKNYKYPSNYEAFLEAKNLC